MRENSTTRTVRWAILGTGAIANDMVQVLKQLPRTEVIAVGSRSGENAKWFGNRWGISRCYSSYEGAASDRDVDVCYIATPMERHPEDCFMAIRHGKAILCEKSMAPNHIIGKKILDAAKKANTLFVHGVWSRFFPAMQQVKKIIDSGEIGTVQSARASFCQNFRAGSCSAILETGIYCAQFLQWVLDDNASVRAPAVRGACQTLHDSGEDEFVSALIEFEGGKIGTLECSLSHCSERSAFVYGTDGVIEVPFPFWCPTKIKVTKMTGLGSQRWSETVTYDYPLPENIKSLAVTDDKGNEVVPGFNFVNSQGLSYEAAEVNRCFREGLVESFLFPSSQCFEILQLLSDVSEVAAANHQVNRKRKFT